MAVSLRSAGTVRFFRCAIANVVDADELVIWTDVDGIYTANPHESTEQNCFMNFLTIRHTHLPQPARKFCTPRFFRWPPKRNGGLGSHTVQAAFARHPHSAQSSLKFFVKRSRCLP